MNPQTEPSLKQRNMLIAYQEARRDVDWPKLECAIMMLKLARAAVAKRYNAKTPANTPAG